MFLFETSTIYASVIMVKWFEINYLKAIQVLTADTISEIFEYEVYSYPLLQSNSKPVCGGGELHHFAEKILKKGGILQLYLL